jgi:hypothetical protein
VRTGTFGALIAPASPRHRSLRTLHEVRSGLSPDADLAARVEQIELVGVWLLSKRQAAKVDYARPGEMPQVLRLRMLVQALTRVPAMRRGRRPSATRVAHAPEAGGPARLARFCPHRGPRRLVGTDVRVVRQGPRLAEPALADGEA